MKTSASYLKWAISGILIIASVQFMISCSHIPESAVNPESNSTGSDTSGNHNNNPGSGNNNSGGNGDTAAVYNSRVCFTRDILPIVQTNCAVPGCHDGKSGSIGGDESGDNGGGGDGLFALNNYNDVMKIVSPGNPGSSSLYNAITGGSEEFMPPPPNAALNSAQIDSIHNWIQDGALNEICGTPGTSTGGNTGGGITCDTTNVTFSATVWPIIQTYCFGCHNGANAQMGVHLENYSNVSAVASSGMLTNVIKGQSGYPLMPPAGALSSCQIAQIQKWITNGTPNNRIAATSSATTTLTARQ